VGSNPTPGAARAVPH